MNLLEHLSSKNLFYEDNRAYRQCLRELFIMNPSKYSEIGITLYKLTFSNASINSQYTYGKKAEHDNKKRLYDS
jgi:hypothetical protein